MAFQDIIKNPVDYNLYKMCVVQQLPARDYVTRRAWYEAMLATIPHDINVLFFCAFLHERCVDKQNMR